MTPYNAYHFLGSLRRSIIRYKGFKWWSRITSLPRHHSYSLYSWLSAREHPVLGRRADCVVALASLPINGTVGVAVTVSGTIGIGVASLGAALTAPGTNVVTVGRSEATARTIGGTCLIRSCTHSLGRIGIRHRCGRCGRRGRRGQRISLGQRERGGCARGGNRRGCCRRCDGRCWVVLDARAEGGNY